MRRVVAVRGREQEVATGHEQAQHLAQDAQAALVIDHADPVAREHDEIERAIRELGEAACIGLVEADVRKPLPAVLHHLSHVVHADIALADGSERLDGPSRADADVQHALASDRVDDAVERDALGHLQLVAPAIGKGDEPHRAAIDGVNVLAD